MIERQILSDVAWGMIAFCLWVPLIPVAKRLRLPGAVGLAAAAGWLIARVIVTVALTNRR